MPAVAVVCLETCTNASSWQSDNIQAISGIGSWVTSLGSYVTARLLYITRKTARLVTVGKSVSDPEERSTVVPLCCPIACSLCQHLRLVQTLCITQLDPTHQG